MEFEREEEEDDHEGFLQGDAGFIDVEAFLHLVGWCADAGHAAADELDYEADDVEEDEDAGEGAGFQFEEAVGGDVEVDHAAEYHVAEGVHPWVRRVVLAIYWIWVWKERRTYKVVRGGLIIGRRSGCRKIVDFWR